MSILRWQTNQLTGDAPVLAAHRLVGIEQTSRVDLLLQILRTLVCASEEGLLPLGLQDARLASICPVRDIAEWLETLVGEVETQIRDIT